MYVVTVTMRYSLNIVTVTLCNLFLFFFVKRPIFMYLRNKGHTIEYGWKDISRSIKTGIIVYLNPCQELEFGLSKYIR